MISGRTDGYEIVAGSQLSIKLSGASWRFHHSLVPNCRTESQKVRAALVRLLAVSPSTAASLALLLLVFFCLFTLFHPVCLPALLCSIAPCRIASHDLTSRHGRREPDSPEESEGALAHCVFLPIHTLLLTLIARLRQTRSTMTRKRKPASFNPLICHRQTRTKPQTRPMLH